MQVRIENSIETKIFIAGDYEVAKQVCREFCFIKGCCVTVTKTDYIYSAGEEGGVIVGLINYPRFPKTPRELEIVAEELALKLRQKLCQDSYTIQTIDSKQNTTWYSWRDERESK